MARIFSKLRVEVALGITIFFFATSLIFASQEPSSNNLLAVVSAVAPVFPPIAIVSNTSGNVVVEVKVNAAGDVVSAQVKDGHSLLRQGKGIIEATAKRWRFTSSTQVERLARLTFVFRIMPKETEEAMLTPVFMPPYQVEVRHRPFEPVIDSDPPTNSQPSPRQRKKKTR